MDTYGRYRLHFEPHSDDSSPSVTMEFSGQANIEQMLSAFDAFLKANGYVYDGEVQIVEGEEAFDKQYWQSKYLELLRSPSEAVSHYNVTCQGSQGVDFVPFSSSMADDVFTSGLG
jgi:hypothetical protein